MVQTWDLEKKNGFQESSLYPFRHEHTQQGIAVHISKSKTESYRTARLWWCSE